MITSPSHAEKLTEESLLGPEPQQLQLTVSGMTCGACAARVERALNRIDGVEARVNYATERAAVTLRPDLRAERLLEAVTAAGYEAQVLGPELADDASSAEQEARRLRRLKYRLIVAAVLFMPLCDLSILLSAYPSLRLAGWRWLMVALAAPVVTWAAWPFYVAAARAARHRTTTMDTLVSIGIVAASGWSLYAMFWLDRAHHHGGGDIYLDVPAGVTAFLLAGRYFEAWSRRRAGNALRSLATLSARDVAILGADGREHRRASAALVVGDRFVIRPGETIATDGEVLDGSAAIDCSAMTGESEPRDVAAGDQVLGGSVSLTGRLVVRATRVGRDTQLGQMLRLVEQAQNERADVQRLADRISSVFVPVVMLIAAITLIVWLATDGASAASFNAALSVLIIACPCALGLATPAALVAATWAGASSGIFFKGYRTLEASRAIDTVVIDKTGTLTTGRMRVAQLIAQSGSEDELLRLAGAVEGASEHPVGRAISAAASERFGSLPAVDRFAAAPGSGVSGYVGGAMITVLRARPAELPEPLRESCERAAAEGRTVVVVGRDGEPIGAVALTDGIRDSAPEAVTRLNELGLRCILATGDNPATAASVAAEVGISEVRAGLLPAEKVELIGSLRASGHAVAMVGDGINDAPALACADLGIAIGSGTDAAISAADLIVVRDDLTIAARGIALARRTLGTIRGNLAWAFAYNLVALPLAAFGLLNPLIAGGAMALSSAFVVSNSARLRRSPSPTDR